ncbi:hypothetical protein V8F06_004447 [Rhypophila decipiens]
MNQLREVFVPGCVTLESLIPLHVKWDNGEFRPSANMDTARVHYHPRSNARLSLLVVSFTLLLNVNGSYLSPQPSDSGPITSLPIAQRDVLRRRDVTPSDICGWIAGEHGGDARAPLRCSSTQSFCALVRPDIIGCCDPQALEIGPAACEYFTGCYASTEVDDLVRQATRPTVTVTSTFDSFGSSYVTFTTSVIITTTESECVTWAFEIDGTIAASTYGCAVSGTSIVVKTTISSDALTAPVTAFYNRGQGVPSQVDATGGQPTRKPTTAESSATNSNSRPGSTPTDTTGPTSGKEGLGVGRIVGIVVGVMAFIIGVVVMSVLVLRRKLCSCFSASQKGANTISSGNTSDDNDFDTATIVAEQGIEMNRLTTSPRQHNGEQQNFDAHRWVPELPMDQEEYRSPTLGPLNADLETSRALDKMLRNSAPPLTH